MGEDLRIQSPSPGLYLSKITVSLGGRSWGVSHQGWLRALMGGGPPRGNRTGELRLFSMMKPEEEEKPGICLSKTPG